MPAPSRLNAACHNPACLLTPCAILQRVHVRELCLCCRILHRKETRAERGQRRGGGTETE
eukprot:877222-Rhodomonas_salina.1